MQGAEEFAGLTPALPGKMEAIWAPAPMPRMTAENGPRNAPLRESTSLVLIYKEQLSRKSLEFS
jgi:hypothetical protein